MDRCGNDRQEHSRPEVAAGRVFTRFDSLMRRDDQCILVLAGTEGDGCYQ